MHAKLITLGAALFLVGLLLVGWTLAERPGVRTEVVAPGMDQRGPNLVLPVTAGLCMAAGGAMVGIGANRWQAHRRRRTGRL